MLQWNHHLVNVHSPLKLNGLHYVWRGGGPGKDATTIGIYNVQSEQWMVQPTTGPPPPGQWGGGCTTVMNHLYCFGGGFNDGGGYGFSKLQ